MQEIQHHCRIHRPASKVNVNQYWQKMKDKTGGIIGMEFLFHHIVLDTYFIHYNRFDINYMTHFRDSYMGGLISQPGKCVERTK